MNKIILVVAILLICCNENVTNQSVNPVDANPKCKEVNLSFSDISCVPGPDCKYANYAQEWFNGACIKAKLGSGYDCESYKSNYILTITECEE